MQAEINDVWSMALMAVKSTLMGISLLIASNQSLSFSSVRQRKISAGIDSVLGLSFDTIRLRASSFSVNSIYQLLVSMQNGILDIVYKTHAYIRSGKQAAYLLKNNLLYLIRGNK